MVPQGGEEGGGRGVVSLAKRYEEDEDACFARVKELWQDKVGGSGEDGGGLAGVGSGWRGLWFGVTVCSVGGFDICRSCLAFSLLFFFARYRSWESVVGVAGMVQF